MFTFRHFLAATVAASAPVAVLAATPASAQNASPLQCGSVVTTDVRLDHDLVDCPENGLVVGASNITIDLGGHTIDGLGPFNSLSGVYNEIYVGVTVRNGEITEFSRGVEAYQGHDGRYIRLDVSATIEGISLTDADGSIVERSALHGNREGLFMRDSDRVRVSRSTFVGNVANGASDVDSTGNQYERNEFRENGFDGLDTSRGHDAFIQQNVFVANGIDGLNAGAGSDRVRVLRNVAEGNDGFGITVDGDAAFFARNTARDNTGVGILAFDDATDGGRNRATGNGEGDCVNLACG